MIKFEFNVADFEQIMNSVKQQLTKDLSKWVKQATNLLHTEINKLTPRKTWVLKKWNKQLFKKEKNQIGWTILNTIDYAVIVEDGVKWKKYKYHNWKRVIHSWVWNKGYERAIENKWKEIVDIIEKSISL